MICIVNILAIAWELKINTPTLVETFHRNVSLNIYIEPLEHLQKTGKNVAVLLLYKGFGQRIINLWRCLFIAFLGLMRYTRRGTALPCPYNVLYNFVPNLNGNRYIVLGNPFIVLGNPFVVLGNPFVVLGNPFVVLGNPFVVLGNPFIVLGNPFIVLGNPFVVLGNPFVVLGNPFIVFGNPFIVFGNPFIVSACP
ncbi:hypothetical protein NIES4075_40520 [Tolypothrix sp. NIES-4075]|nr:hypothetical protein NIES4075_40520 [Tolypothrix sp. NIES-4075]